ncbi:MAG: HD domain-containing protein [Desulfobacterium sp.]|jgi:hypothetical protein|nr:HD domain-containing protein [Desulfobacterium sp.]
MNIQEFHSLQRDFLDYAATFIDPDTIGGPHVLKRDHSIRVCEEITGLGQALALSKPDLTLARAIALLHDIGRFEQFKRYGTFVDAASENHAFLGLGVIETQKLLQPLPPVQRALIMDAVGFHNAALLPENRDDRTLFFMRLIRDADKLDIWQVVIDHYLNTARRDDKFIDLGLEDRGGYSPGPLNALIEGRFVLSSTIEELNDFKLMQISWVFDLNFSPTFARVKQRRYIEKLASTMPPNPDLSLALDQVFDHLETHTHDT